MLRMAGGTIEGRRVWRSSFLMALVLVVWGITNFTRLLGKKHWHSVFYTYSYVKPSSLLTSVLSGSKLTITFKIDHSSFFHVSVVVVQ